MKRNAHDVCNPPHGRDFRTLGFFLSCVLLDLNGGWVRIFDIRRGADGYDASVRLSPNNFPDDGLTYIDLIAHRRHMIRGGFIEDARSKDLVGWKSSFSSAAHYPVPRWSEFVQHPAETDVSAPIPVHLLQARSRDTRRSPFSPCRGEVRRETKFSGDRG